MNGSRFTRITSALLVCLATGCANVPQFGIPWVKQGPGITPEEARYRVPARPASAQQAAAAAPAERTVSAEPPPPTSGWGVPVAPATAVVAMARPAPGAAPPVGPAIPQASRHGDLLFISGQIPMDLRTRAVASDAAVDEQALLALDNIRSVLEDHKLTMANVVSTTVYLSNINDLRLVDLAYARAFKGQMPSRSVVEVARLPRGARVEISAIAGR